MTSYSYRHQGEKISPDAGFMEELAASVPPEATRFLEWGAGCSTFFFQELARQRNGTVLTVESDRQWFDSIAPALTYAGSRIVLEDLTGPHVSQWDPGLNYATHPLNKGPFDFILIDGRRRIECAVTSLLVAAEGVPVVLHDYRRARYQAVKLFYDCRDGRQFRVMKKK